MGFRETDATSPTLTPIHSLNTIIMPSALITGATGLLGRQVFKAFSDAGWQTTGVGFSRASDTIRKVDITHADAVSALFDEIKPDVVVYCTRPHSLPHPI